MIWCNYIFAGNMNKFYVKIKGRVEDISFKYKERRNGKITCNSNSSLRKIYDLHKPLMGTNWWVWMLPFENAINL